ncbi:MAG: D-alanine--poly(phosphoribitol) ligase subunit 2 [Bacilli bacterium]|nr:D-alanine--poly(phosphoribitol) ligase subunit 2 [Bacilli bacterium]
MKDINICDLLYSICGDKNVYNKDFDLIESGLLDSFAFIELFSELENKGIVIQPTRIDRKMLRTPRLLEELICQVANNR